MSDSAQNTTSLTSPEEAAKRFEKTKERDPFPSIPPALLNSADIHDYIETTGMLYPYDPANLKSSSFEVEIGDKAFYWNEKGRKHTVSLDPDKEVKLPPNSLVFFKTLQYFRLPPYMAIRFNLRISNVHKGLLLGTGPLVDPGFEGHLYIPLHNLTANPYAFKGGENFIWVEFTKISPTPNWDGERDLVRRTGTYQPFPESKKRLKSFYYFQKANEGNPIRNATPAAVQEVKAIAGEAKSDAAVARERTRVGGIIGVLTIVIGLGPLFYASWQLSRDANDTIIDFKDQYSAHLDAALPLENQLTALEGRLEELETQLEKSYQGSVSTEQFLSLQRKLDALASDVSKLRNSISANSKSEAGASEE